MESEIAPFVRGFLAAHQNVILPATNHKTSNTNIPTLGTSKHNHPFFNIYYIALKEHDKILEQIPIP